MTKSVLVIGATGYSGTYLAAGFARAGYRVAALQRPGGRPAPGGYETVPGDLADPPSLTVAAKGFDLVVQHGRIEGEIERLGARALLDSGTRLIHTSGCDVLGWGFVTEDDEPKPPRIVGWRAAVERCVLDGGGIIVRPGLIYGYPGGVVQDMLIPMAERIGAGVYLGEKGRQWGTVHIDDLVDLYLAVAEKAGPGTAWNGVSETVLIDEMATAVGGGNALSWPVRLPPPPEVAEIAELLLFSQDVNADKTRREMDWHPTRDFLGYLWGLHAAKRAPAVVDAASGARP